MKNSLATVERSPIHSHSVCCSCRLFYSPVGIYDYVLSCGRMTGKTEDVAGWLQPTQGTIPTFAWRDWEKP
jgi:hypothetical protein